MNNVQLYMGKRIYSGWKSISVTRSIECMAGNFSLSVALSNEDDPLQLSPGASCRLEIDGQRVITGYTDESEKFITGKERTYTISGRDKTGDLIDCAAIYARGRWANTNLERIANDLCKPFGVVVRWDVSGTAPAAPFKVWTIEPGETVFENLARAARHRGVLVTSNQSGDLVFCTAGRQNVATLTLGNEILELRGRDSWSERYSLYRLIGDNAAGGLWGETQTSEQSTAVKVNVTDTEVSRYRPKILLSDDNLTKAAGVARADWERRRAAAHGQSISVTLTSWFTPSGQLWEPNQLVTINAPTEGVNARELLIVSVSFELSNESAITAKLELMPRDGFDEPAQKESQYTGVWY